eukprot:scaffold14290_cov125-Isochrysis_galbana.AAC.6
MPTCWYDEDDEAPQLGILVDKATARMRAPPTRRALVCMGAVFAIHVAEDWVRSCPCSPPGADCPTPAHCGHPQRRLREVVEAASASNCRNSLVDCASRPEIAAAASKATSTPKVSDTRTAALVRKPALSAADIIAPATLRSGSKRSGAQSVWR